MKGRLQKTGRIPKKGKKGWRDERRYTQKLKVNGPGTAHSKSRGTGKAATSFGPEKRGTKSTKKRAKFSKNKRTVSLAGKNTKSEKCF